MRLVDDLKVIAMQISAMKPMGIDENSINPKTLEDEKDIILKQLNNVPDDKKDQIWTFSKRPREVKSEMI